MKKSSEKIYRISNDFVVLKKHGLAEHTFGWLMNRMLRLVQDNELLIETFKLT